VSKRIRRKSQVHLEEREGVNGKECTHCSVWKPLDEFTYHSTCAGNRDSVCKACRKVYRRKNSESIKVHNKVYKTENKEIIASKDKEYHDKYKERYSILRKEYLEKNKDKMRAMSHISRSEKLGLPYQLTETDITSLYSYFNNQCPISGSEDIQIDHFIPVAKGGETSLKNMILLKRNLNASKWVSNPFEWAPRKLNADELTRFENVVRYLADKNGLTVDEYKIFVNKHFEEEDAQ
jgi:5-methylcytosine-specific restriction endonuclease McrA